MRKLTVAKYVAVALLSERYAMIPTSTGSSSDSTTTALTRKCPESRVRKTSQIGVNRANLVIVIG